MSGSGSGGYGGGFDRPFTGCENLDIRTRVASPNPAVIPKLRVGALLEVQLAQQNGMRVVVLVFNGERVGGVAAPELPKLRECMERGTQYVARVTDIAGAQVGVRIAAAPSA